jgi:hypothetical protein
MDDESLRKYYDADADVPRPPDEESERSLDRHETTPEEMVEDAERRRRGDWVEEADRPPDFPTVL